jgi:hypothetical protein
MAQAARNLAYRADGFLKGKWHLIVDRDSLFSAPFQAILRSSGFSATWVRWSPGTRLA